MTGKLREEANLNLCGSIRKLKKIGLSFSKVQKKIKLSFSTQDLEKDSPLIKEKSNNKSSKLLLIKLLEETLGLLELRMTYLTLPLEKND